MAYNENPSYLQGPVTQYNTLTGGAANSVALIAPGSAGQVLTSNGVSAYPTYQSISPSNTSRPAFSFYSGANQTNATGDGTQVTIAYDTQIFQQGGSNFAANTFTAPITGIYQFSGCFYLEFVDLNHNDLVLYLITTAQTYIPAVCNSGLMRELGSGNNSLMINYCSPYLPMTAGDTCYISLQILGGTKTILIVGSSPTFSSFSGVLIT
jgi:hypothetical protein